MDNSSHLLDIIFLHVFGVPWLSAVVAIAVSLIACGLRNAYSTASRPSCCHCLNESAGTVSLTSFLAVPLPKLNISLKFCSFLFHIYPAPYWSR